METVSYKCPNCSAPLSFDIESQNWKCKFCYSEFTSNDLGRIEALSSSETIEEREDVTAAQTQVKEEALYVCPGCGGKIITTPATAATFCVYCHNPAIIASRLSEKENLPAYLIPFKLKKEEAVKKLQSLCSRKIFLPKNFKRMVSAGEVSGLYVPFWLFDIDIDLSFTARGLKTQFWSDSIYRYTKTDNYDVVRSGKIFFKNVPVDGSVKMDDNLMQQLEPFNYSQMLDFKMEYLSGHFAEIHDDNINAAEEKALSRVFPGARNALLGTAHEYSSLSGTNHSLNKKETSRINVMLPVWVLMAECNGKKYVFTMNGQTGKMSGYLPKSPGVAFALYLKISLTISLIFFIGGMLI